MTTKKKFRHAILTWMAIRQISNAELAKRINTSQPYVTKLLNGKANLTIESMVKIACALDCKLEISINPN